MKNEELLKELKKRIIEGKIEVKDNVLSCEEYELNLSKLAKLNELKEKRGKINQFELWKKHLEENEQPEGYMNCLKDACMFGLGTPCEKHKPILERQKKEEELAEEEMKDCHQQIEQLEKELEITQAKTQIPPK